MQGLVSSVASWLRVPSRTPEVVAASSSQPAAAWPFDYALSGLKQVFALGRLPSSPPRQSKALESQWRLEKNAIPSLDALEVQSAPPSVACWPRDLEDEDEDGEEENSSDRSPSPSSSASGLSEVYSLPEFVHDREDSGQELLRVSLDSASFGQRSKGSKAALPVPVIHTLEPASMQHMEQWLAQQLHRRSVALPRNVVFRSSERCQQQQLKALPGAGAMVGRPPPPPPLLLLENHRCLSCDGSPVAIEKQRVSSVFLPSWPAPLLLLPAPLFLPEALEVGLYCEKGTRLHNEDMAFSMKLDPVIGHATGFQQAVCCGLFDGHGGVEVAQHLTDILPDLVAQRSHHIKQEGVQEVATIMLGCEADLLLRYEEEWRPQDRDPGSTALLATVMDDRLLVANVGDCRLLLVSEAWDTLGNRTAFVSRATADHNCTRNPHEARRVRAAGGDIDEAGYIGSTLEVSRSMGDFLTKTEVGHGVIIADPEVYTWKLGPQELLAIAVSDGISGTMDDQEICNMVTTLLNDKKHLNDPVFAARELAQFAAFAKHSTDNCSAVIVVLKNGPPPAPARRRLFSR